MSHSTMAMLGWTPLSFSNRVAFRAACATILVRAACSTILIHVIQYVRNTGTSIQQPLLLYCEATRHTFFLFVL